MKPVESVQLVRATDVVLRIECAGEVLVEIGQDRSMVFGPTYDPDEAAIILWEAIVRNMPAMLPLDPAPTVKGLRAIERGLRR